MSYHLNNNLIENLKLPLLMAALGVSAIMENGYQHPVMLYLALVFAACGTYQYLKDGFNIPPSLQLFLAFNLLALVWSVDRQQTLLELMLLGIYAAVYLLLRNGTTFANKKRLADFLLLLGSLIALTGILMFLFVSGSRIKATFINPNPFGIYMVMLALPALARIAYEESRWSWNWPAGIAMLAALLFSGSRGSVLSLLAAVALLLLTMPRRRLKPALKKWLLLFLIVLLLVRLFSAAAPHLQGLGKEVGLERLLIRSESFGSSSVEGRLSFWKVAVKMTAARPLTGMGPGNFHTAYMSFRNQDYWYSRFAHNHYLQTAAETGLPGLLFLLIFLGTAIRRILGKREEFEPSFFWGLAAASLAFLLHIGMDFSWNMPAVTLLFWAFLGILDDSGTDETFGNKKGKKGGSKVFAVIFIAILFLLPLQQLSALALDNTAHKAAAGSNWQKAIKFAAAAYSINPWNPSQAYELSRFWQESQDGAAGENALLWAKKAAVLSPLDADYLGYAGRLNWQRGNLRAAEDYLVKARNASGYLPRGANDLGYFYLENDQPAAAAGVFMTGLNLLEDAYRNARSNGKEAELVPQEINMRLGLAKACEDLGFGDRAKEQLAKVLEIDSENPVALREIAKY